MGENTRLIYDIIEECNNQNSKALLILIDFEKAFDSISWEFIAKILALFNFGENTINWVKSLEKTKVAKLGVWGDNRNILCQDINLDWTQKFTLLGIKYNIDNINNITDNNIEQKIGEIKKTNLLMERKKSNILWENNNC